MILRDGRNVVHNLGPMNVRGWSVLSLKPISGKGFRQGEDYKEVAKRLRFKPKRAISKIEPVLLQVSCARPACKTVFETRNARKAFCSERCVKLRWRQLNPRPGLPKLRVVATTLCGHPDKPVRAHGKCHPCYMRAWRAERKTA